MKFIRNICSIETPVSKNRIIMLDFIRGVFILLILYHHAGAPLNKYVLQFHMPALFFLSGYTEFVLNRKTTFFNYVKSRFFRLVVPYFMFEATNFIYFASVEIITGSMNFSYVEATKSILSCINNLYMGLYGRLWFLPAMFVCSVVCFIIKEYIARGKNSIIAFFVAVMLVLSYLSYTAIPFRLPFTLDTACLASAFFLAGHLFGKCITRYLDCKKLFYDIVLICGMLAVFVFCNIVANPECFMFINYYRDFLYMVITAFAGTLLVFAVVKLATPFIEKTDFVKKIILWYSVNSLTVFPIHLTIKVISIPMLRVIGLYNWVVLFALMFFIDIPVVNVIRRYFPFMIGDMDWIFQKAKKIIRL